MSIHHVVGMRSQDDSCTRSPSPRAPPRFMGLPARPCSRLPTSPCWAGGWGSLPISAAQLPAVLILTALGVIHLVHTETLLEVLGPDLGIQDLLSRAAGEPASLLVMQTLAKDPPCAGRAEGQSPRRGLAEPSWHREGGTGVQRAFPEAPAVTAPPETLRLGLPPICWEVPP